MSRMNVIIMLALIGALAFIHVSEAKPGLGFGIGYGYNSGYYNRGYYGYGGYPGYYGGYGGYGGYGYGGYSGYGGYGGYGPGFGFYR